MVGVIGLSDFQDFSVMAYSRQNYG